MMKTKKWGLVLVACMVFLVGCNSNVSARTDAKLNGTWVALTIPDETMRIVENSYRRAGITGFQLMQIMEEAEATMLRVEMRKNNGNFELVVDDISNARGTFTTNGGKLTTRTTHMHGGPIGLESRWYTIDELRRTLIDMNIPVNLVNAMFSTLALEEIPSEYSVTENTLTTTHPVGGQTIYTRRR